MKNNILRIIILGNKGFIGRNIERSLKKNRDIEVIGFDISDFDLTSPEGADNLKKVFTMNSAVIMCSAIKKEYGDSIDNFQKNVSMAVNISSILNYFPVRRFIFFSSAAVYGEDIQNLNINEDSHIVPTSYYGIAKFACERLLWKAISAKKDCSFVAVRPPVIYGLDDGPSYGPSGFVKHTLMNEKIILWGDGSEKREFIFIDDIVDIISRLLFVEFSGTLNIASGKSYSFKEIIIELENISGKKIDVESMTRSKAKVDHIFDNKKLTLLFQDLKFTPLHSALERTYLSFQRD